MRIDTLMISLFLFTLGTIGCSQPEAVDAQYEPADCNCVEQTSPSEAPPARGDGLADESTPPATTIAQAAPAFPGPAEASADDEQAFAEPVDQTQPAADTNDSPPKADKKADKKTDKKAKGDPNGVVNLNTASVAQLTALPGVGPALASRIIEYRQKRRFEEAKHLLRVRGIGEATFAKLAPMLAVSGATTLAK